MSNPEINVPQFEMINRCSVPMLKSIVVINQVPFGQALEALGVPASEVPEWKVQIGIQPEDSEREPRTIWIDTHHVAELMGAQAKSKGATTSNYARYYVDAFKDCATAAFLGNAMIEIKNSTQTWSKRSERGLLYKNGASLGAWALTFAGTRWGFGTSEATTFLSASTASLAVVPIISRYTLPSREIKKDSEKFLQANPRLIRELELSILPVFAK